MCRALSLSAPMAGACTARCDQSAAHGTTAGPAWTHEVLRHACSGNASQRLHALGSLSRKPAAQRMKHWIIGKQARVHGMPSLSTLHVSSSQIPTHMHLGKGPRSPRATPSLPSYP